MKYAARVDATQDAIMQALRACGVTVDDIGQPLDLLAGYRGAWHFVECKSSRYEALGRKSATRIRQMDFRLRHPNGGPIHTVWTPEQAIEAICEAKTRAV